MAIPDKFADQVDDENANDYLCPFPVRYVLEKGFRMRCGCPVCDGEYREDIGLCVPEEYCDY